MKRAPMMQTSSNLGTAVDQSMVGRLLAMAHQYRGEGNVRQASEIYWTLAESHAGTVQAEAAKGVLLAMAGEYERNGARRMARSIYERLMDMGA